MASTVSHVHDAEPTAFAVVPEATPDQLKAAIVASVKEEAYLDESRLAFVEAIAGTLVQLVDGGLRDCNRFNRLLLGRKAVGKTYLLEKLCLAAKKHLGGRRLACCVLDCTQLETASLVEELGPLVGYTPAAPSLGRTRQNWCGRGVYRPPRAKPGLCGDDAQRRICGN